MSDADRPPTRKCKEFDYSSLDNDARLFVQQQTGEIRGFMKRTAQGIIEIGQRLIDVKERLGHGRFLDWLDGEFDWSWDTAKRFMRVAEVFGQNQQCADFNVAPSALYELAAPSTPEVARTEAIARAQAGEAITPKTARAIKQKHASATNKSEPLPESKLASQSQATPASSSRQGSKQEIVAIRPGQAPTLGGATERMLSQAATTSLALPLSPTVPTSESPGVLWQLGGRHLLFCGQPNSEDFVARIPNDLKLLLAFPPANIWQSRITAEARVFLADYLPIFQNSGLLDEVLETLILSNSSINDVVVVSFVPSPDILSVVNRFERRGVLAEPNLRRCNAVVADWKKAGLKVERLS